jgi:hypothetical protein
MWISSVVPHYKNVWSLVVFLRHRIMLQNFCPEMCVSTSFCGEQNQLVRWTWTSRPSRHARMTAALWRFQAQITGTSMFGVEPFLPEYGSDTVSICAGLRGRGFFMLVMPYISGFGGLVVSVLASGTRVRGCKPGRNHRIFFGCKNPQHAFLRKGSKAVGPVSQLCGTLTLCRP